MAKELARITLIVGQDSLRSDRALAVALKVREVDSSEIIRIWGDEASFADVFAAVGSRSLFSDRTVVVVRRAEKLKGGGKDSDEEAEDGGDSEGAEAVEEKPRGRRGPARSGAPTPGEVPELDSSSTLILVARKVDRRLGMWKKLSKVADVVDVDYLKGKALLLAAAAEAKALGLRASEEALRDTVEQSGPSLGRIVSELEKMLLYRSAPGASASDLVAVTSSPPLYLLADALLEKDRRKSLNYLDDALRQGEAALRVLATLHSTVRRLALFRALRRNGIAISDAGTQAGIMSFKVMEAERSARAWSDLEIGRALSIFAEADRRLKLSAPAAPVLTHAVVRVATGVRA